MSALALFAPIVMIALAIFLSISAFYGGYHFAHYNFLSKMRKLNDHIVHQPASKENNLTLETLNNFLIDINVENNKPRIRDWFKFGAFHGGK